jgi:hypothetical protein
MNVSSSSVNPNAAKLALQRCLLVMIKIIFCGCSLALDTEQAKANELDLHADVNHLTETS